MQSFVAMLFISVFEDREELDRSHVEHWYVYIDG